MLVRIVGGHGGMAPGFRTTSYLIDGKILIDAGSSASGLLIEEQVQIDNVLLSHPHLDHISDLAFMCENCQKRRDSPFDVFTTNTTKNAVLDHLMNDIIWPDFSKESVKGGAAVKFHIVKPGEEFSIGDYKIMPISVNHPCDALGFLVSDQKSTVLFTQDTGPTEEIWEIAKSYKNLKAIFTEISFPNFLKQVAIDSQHHTPNTMKDEIIKMPKDVPIFLGHLKPNFQAQLYQEIEDLHEERLSLLGSDDTSYVFN